MGGEIAMTAYVIWTRGLRGPAISVLRGSPHLGEYDRRVILSGPTPMATEHERLTLEELAKLYPKPFDPESLDARASRQ